MDTPVTPAGSEITTSSTLSSPAPQHGVLATPAPKPQRVRNRKKAGSGTAAPVGLHLADMQARGLEYIGPSDVVAMPPKTGRVVPSETMDGPTAAYHIRTHDELAWVVTRGLFRIPPAKAKG